MNTEMKKLVSDIKAGKTISVKRHKRVFKLKDLLIELEEYFEPKADADSQGANDEMKFLDRIREAQKETA